MLITLLLHDPHLFLIRDSYLVAAFGPLCLISLVFPRPVAFYAGRYLYAHTPEQIAYYNAGWQVPYVRFATRLITVVWGLAFLGEVLTDTFLAYHLPTALFLAIHPFLYWGTILAVFGEWTIPYTRHTRKRRRAIEARMRQVEQEQTTRAGVDSKALLH